MICEQFVFWPRTSGTFVRPCWRKSSTFECIPCGSRECSTRHSVRSRDGQNGPAHEGGSYGRSTAQCFCTTALKWRSAAAFFVRDAFTNVAHIQFALKRVFDGQLVLHDYNGLDWPGISTAVTTCFLTALSSVGFVSAKTSAPYLRSPGGWLPCCDGLTSVYLASSGFDCGIHYSFLSLSLPSLPGS